MNRPIDLLAVAGLIDVPPDPQAQGRAPPRGNLVQRAFTASAQVLCASECCAWPRPGGTAPVRTCSSDRLLAGDANVVIEPFQSLGTTSDGINEGGVTNMPCTAPCRPDATETIVLSPNNGSALELVLIHELGHAMGLAHTHTSACSVMAPIAGQHCPGLSLPPQIRHQIGTSCCRSRGRAATTANEGSGT